MSDYKSNGDLIKLGALWEGKGKSLFNGQVNNDTRIVILKNDHKKEDKHPDAFIFLAVKEKREETTDRSGEDRRGRSGPDHDEMHEDGQTVDKDGFPF